MRWLAVFFSSAFDYRPLYKRGFAPATRHALVTTMNPTGIHIPATYGPAARAGSTAAMLKFSNAELRQAFSQVEAEMKRLTRSNYDQWNNEGLHLIALRDALSVRSTPAQMASLNARMSRL